MELVPVAGDLLCLYSDTFMFTNEFGCYPRRKVDFPALFRRIQDDVELFVYLVVKVDNLAKTMTVISISEVSKETYAAKHIVYDTQPKLTTFSLNFACRFRRID